ncbi:hypothetical protein GCM10025771_25570 [Niveibacterium umoris]|uniref:Uncharacterized protein n=1 Tax=Niveibacterium umoris TaxID=1193620 RepID=A0A840BGF0_9RHOO|nr:hypothetical protein [Niveibacterium umoris]MBB4012255.1 hypothetical protein [Niveibacterium umoris]
MGTLSTQLAIGRGAGRQLPFPESLDSINEVAEPFRSLMAKRFAQEGAPRAIIHTPRFETYGLSVPENTLAIGSDFWWVAFANGESGVVAREASFAKTRVIELSQLLLHGELRLDAGEAESSCVVAFNMVGADLFRAVVHEILAGLPANPAANVGFGTTLKADPALPFKLRSAMQESMPATDPVRGLASWPEVTGKAGRPPVPAGLLATSDRYLCIILDALPPRSGQPPAGLNAWGKVVTFVNRAFPLAWTLLAVEQGSELCLLVGHGRASSLRIGLPSASVLALERVLDALRETPPLALH